MSVSKSIEERARDIAHSINPHSNNPQDEFGWGYYRALKDGYIVGAHQQRTIDIDKACEWWSRELREVNYETYDETIDAFRKAMMEE